MIASTTQPSGVTTAAARRATRASTERSAPAKRTVVITASATNPVRLPTSLVRAFVRPSVAVG
jgi:hypothetical protein